MRPDRRAFTVLAPIAVLPVALAAFGAAPARAQEPVEAEPVSGMSTRIEVTLPGSPTAIYDAITGDISPWWDHHISERPVRLHIEPKPGGHFIEIFDESGDGAIHATVIHANRGEVLRFAGPLGFAGYPVDIVTTYTFEPVGADSTRLVVVSRAAGTLNEQSRNAIARVWQHFIVGRFKPYVEARHARGELENP